jgi:hypothetical protein
MCLGWFQHHSPSFQNMPSPLIVAIGMPRAGSGWHYNLIHDLVVEAGGQDARMIRRRYLLHRILTEVNCNIGAFTNKRLIPVMVPAFLNNTFVIKAHAGPSPLALRLIKNKMIKPLYIYRDPRDALLSAFEYGQRKREASRTGAFSDLIRIKDAITFMTDYVRISKSWLSCEYLLSTRYEDFVTDFGAESKRIFDFLGLGTQTEGLNKIFQKYHPTKGHSNQQGTHFVKGKIGRYREKLSKREQQLCIEVFGDFLEIMGYPVP